METSNLEKTEYICEICDKTFETNKQRLRHKYLAHIQFVYKCICGKTIKTKSYFKKHIDNEINKIETCKLSDKNTTQLNKLNHIKDLLQPIQSKNQYSSKRKDQIINQMKDYIIYLD